MPTNLVTAGAKATSTAASKAPAKTTSAVTSGAKATTTAARAGETTKVKAATTTPKSTASVTSGAKAATTAATKSAANLAAASADSGSAGGKGQGDSPAKRGSTSPAVTISPSNSTYNDNALTSGRMSDTGSGTSFADLDAFKRSPSSGKIDIGNPMALDPNFQSLENPISQFLDDADKYRLAQIAARAAAGVKPSEGIVDWNGIQYELNQPYRDRLAREAEAAGVPFDPLQTLVDAHPAKMDAFNARNALIDPALSFDAVQAFNKPASKLVNVPGGPPEVINKNEARLADERPLAAQELGIAGATPTQVAAASPKAFPAWGSYSRGLAYDAMHPDASSGGIDVAMNLPGQVEGAGPAVAAAPKKSSVWDNIVDGASGIAENNLLVGAVKNLFPDFYYGGVEGIKSWDDRTGPVKFPVIDNSDHPERGSKGSHAGMIWDPVTGQWVYPPRKPPVTPPVTPPTTPGTPSTGQPTYDRFGRVVFPQMPPYRPGIDNEWLYFQKMADGGIVGYADGGAVAPPADPLAGGDPRVDLIAETEDVLAEVVNGKKPDARDAEVLKKFVKTFGDTALKQLHDSVKEGNSIRGGRLVRGEGGPKDDAIPARVDNVHEARLSDGEYVVPAAAVAAAGNGDHAAGAQKMQEMSNALQGIGPGQPMNVEQVG